MVLLAARRRVGGIRAGGVWVLGGRGGGCGRVGGGRAGFLSLGRLFVAALLVLDEDLTHELGWAGDLLARLQLHSSDKEKHRTNFY